MYQFQGLFTVTNLSLYQQPAAGKYYGGFDMLPSNISNNQWHEFTFDWQKDNAGGGTLTYQFDAIKRSVTWTAAQISAILVTPSSTWASPAQRDRAVRLQKHTWSLSSRFLAWSTRQPVPACGRARHRLIKAHCSMAAINCNITTPSIMPQPVSSLGHCLTAISPLTCKR